MKERGETPNLRLYSALLHSCVSAEHGSAAKVASFLREMKSEGIELDAETCHNVLEALAVHPDYLQRAEILEYMRERWFPLTNEGHNYIVAALLRDRNYELALEKIDTMALEGIHVHPWLYDKAIYMLLDIGEVEEAYQLAVSRLDLDMSPAVWNRLLDVASKSCHHEATKYVWKSRVESSYMIPSSGICFNVLNTAARNGDAELATDVFRVLGNRRTAFTHHHYEMLIEAYIAAEDLKSSLSVLIIMKEAGIKLEASSTLSIFQYLQRHKSRPMLAYHILQEIHDAGDKVPTVAMNCAIQACVAIKDLDGAIEMYKAIHTVCEEGPNTATFNLLFKSCHVSGRKELAMFLASEMIQLGCVPDAITYNRLILVCLTNREGALATNINDAVRYFEEMREQGWKARPGTYFALIRHLAKARDKRCFEVFDDMRQQGFEREGVDIQEWKEFLAKVDIKEASMASGDSDDIEAGPSSQDLERS